MIRFGFDFDYKLENRRAWMLFAGLVLTNFLILAITFYTTFNYFMEYSVIDFFEYVTSTLNQNQNLNAQTFTYVFLLHNLQKRYALLNQLLRYFHFNCKITKCDNQNFLLLFCLFHNQKTYFQWK